MIKRQVRGGDLNLIVLLRHDLAEYQVHRSRPHLWRNLTLVLVFITATMVAALIFQEV